MKVSIRQHDSVTYRVLKGAIIVGYIRYDGRPRQEWIVVDHIAGHDVRTCGTRTGALREAKDYFAGLDFCTEGCGRLTGAGVCGSCLEQRKLSARDERALCWVRGPFGDIYKVVKLDETFVIVGNVDHWAPSIYSAATLLEDLHSGIKELVKPLDLPSDITP